MAYYEEELITNDLLSMHDEEEDSWNEDEEPSGDKFDDDFEDDGAGLGEKFGEEEKEEEETM